MNHLGRNAEAIADEWGPLHEGADRHFPPAPSRSTCYGWIKNGFPKVNKNSDDQSYSSKFYQSLAFCGQIDLDPLAIFDLERNGYESDFFRLRTLIYRGISNMGAIAPIFELYQPDEFWPSAPLLKRFWGKSWSEFLFNNDDHYMEQNYGLLRVKFQDHARVLPRAVHIAYRRIDSRDKDRMWRFYGTVRKLQDTVELFTESGIIQKSGLPRQCDLQFRTFLGGRRVEFKLASMHEFQCDVVYPCNDMSIIGFNW